VWEAYTWLWRFSWVVLVQIMLEMRDLYSVNSSYIDTKLDPMSFKVKFSVKIKRSDILNHGSARWIHIIAHFFIGFLSNGSYFLDNTRVKVQVFYFIVNNLLLIHICWSSKPKLLSFRSKVLTISKFLLEIIFKSNSLT